MTERSLIREVIYEKMKEPEVLYQLAEFIGIKNGKEGSLILHDLDFPSFAYDLGMDDEYIGKVNDNLPFAFETDTRTYLVFFIERAEVFDDFITFTAQAFIEMEVLSIKQKIAQKLAAKPFRVVPIVLFNITEEQKDKLKEAVTNARCL